MNQKDKIYFSLFLVTTALCLVVILSTGCGSTPHKKCHPYYGCGHKIGNTGGVAYYVEELQ